MSMVNAASIVSTLGISWGAFSGPSSTSKLGEALSSARALQGRFVSSQLPRIVRSLRVECSVPGKESNRRC